MLPNSDAEAWQALCTRFARLGERLLDDDFPPDPLDRAEGFAHLADQIVTFLGWAVRHTDPYLPHFQRHNDLTSQWGGPNIDNAYKHARIDPNLRYRIRGKMHGCEDFILAVRVGFMHMPSWGTRKEISASELGIGPGDEFQLLLGGAASEPGGANTSGGASWIELPAETSMVSIREYYVDWQPVEPAVITIECLDEPPPVQRMTPEAIAARLDDAGELVERSLEYWNAYMRDGRAGAPVNEFAGGFQQAKGLATARYDFCRYELDIDEALLIESTVPDAAYWSFHLYTDGWFEVPDREQRVTARNHAQNHVSADGLIRVVVARRDPGVANWLDCAERPSGQLTFRWFWPRSDDHPTISTQVVPVDSVLAVVPADTPRLDAAGRSAELARRRAHMSWRFRV